MEADSLCVALLVVLNITLPDRYRGYKMDTADYFRTNISIDSHNAARRFKGIHFGGLAFMASFCRPFSTEPTMQRSAFIARMAFSRGMDLS